MDESLQQLRICLVAYMISRQATGLSTYVADLVTHLLDEGHQVTVLATDCGYRGTKGGELPTIDSRASTLVFPVRGRANRKLYHSSALSKWLSVHIREFDLVDIQGIWAFVNIDAARIAIKAGVPYVITPHGMMTRWDWSKRKLFKRILYRFKIKNIWTRAATIRFLSEGEFANSAVPVECPYVVIPNAVAPFNGAFVDKMSVCASNGIPVENHIILFLGRICRQKGALDLLQAFELLFGNRTDVSLLMVGPAEKGEYTDQLTNFVAQSPAKANIHLPGPTFGDEKYSLYRAADVFVTLSRNEGLSIAALESLAEGLPVLLTADSNLPDVQEFDAGVVTVCEPVAVAAALMRLLEDNERLFAMKANALRLHRERFSWPVVLPQLTNLYRTLARCHRGSGDVETR